VTCKKSGLKYADYSLIHDTSSIIDAEEAAFGGGNKSIGQKKIYLSNLSLKVNKKNLRIEFINKDSAFFSVTPSVLGWGDSWENYKGFSLNIVNTSANDIEFVIDIIGIRAVLPFRFFIQANSVKHIDTTFNELLLTGNNLKGYFPVFLKFSFFNAKNSQLIIKDFALIEGLNHSAIMDSLGQRKYAQWKGKIDKVSDLKAQIISSDSTYISRKSKLDKYGGLITEKYPAKGYFYVAQDKSKKYWFITPDGHPFWSFGVTGVRYKHISSDVTEYASRKYLFECLPPNEKPYDICYTDSNKVSFYAWNILRKYGNLDNWRLKTLQKLDNWGINTIGNWSEDSICLESTMPFTYSYRTNTRQSLVYNGIPDVFNPKWNEHVDSIFTDMHRWRNNPYLLGYFIDNEMDWESYKWLDANESFLTKKQWLQFIKNKYKTVQKINELYTLNLTRLDSLDNMVSENYDKSNDAIKRDLEEFMGEYAKQYFSVIRSLLKKHDPNHLYLGCRFTKRLKPMSILKEAAMYCDVVSVNIYSYVPDNKIAYAWYNAVKKPLIIGEHHLPLVSNRQLAPLYKAFSEEERYIGFTTYVKTWANYPFSVGSHWYQYVDQPITGRAGDGENQVVGFVDITDQPHTELIEAASYISNSIYLWHAK